MIDVEQESIILALFGFLTVFLGGCDDMAIFQLFDTSGKNFVQILRYW